ncbi:MAG: dihydrolipoamide acetyltransferase family protein [Nitrososphaerales archaeon]
MTSYEFKLPDIGEGVAEGEVLKWLVSEGDIVKEDQPLVEVMTDKVNVEIPSPKSGRIAKIVAKVGDVVGVGQSLVVFEVEDAESGTPQQSQSKHELGQASEVIRQDAQGNVLAAPATRKLASQLGVDIQSLVGTGQEGRVTVEDVQKASENFARSKSTIASSVAEDQSDKRTELVPLRGMRKTIAERMVRSAHNAAHVTHVDEVDVTELVLLRNKLNSRADNGGENVKLTFLPFIIRALVPALKEFPYVNASIDDQKQEIVLKKYYNIGIATDTDQGLIVPVIRNVDEKSIFNLAIEIEDLVEKARTGNLNLDEVRDSTFTLTNVGSIGGLFSTPLVNYPEVAILGIQRIIKRPVVKNDSVVVRDMMNLSLSFDHRVLDGAYAARFLNRVIAMIENPAILAE